MITTKGNIIDINGKTEWVLFHRMSKKINPADFLALTDCMIMFPNFLFTLSYLIMIFVPVDLQFKFLVPASMYFLGQIIVNLRVGTFLFQLLNMPLLVFLKFYQIIIPLTFIVGFFFLDLWNIAIIPAYIMAITSSVLILTSYQRRYYKSHWNKTAAHYDIFKNNAFLHAYKYYATRNDLPVSTSLTQEEIKNEDWKKPYGFMRNHWKEIESLFNRKARVYWRVYLQIDK